MATLTAKSTRGHATPTARLEARISRDLKKTLERAAAVTGHPTLTSYMIYTLQTSASKVIEEHQRAKLTTDESTNFVDALLAPAAPNAALRGAFGRYRREVHA
ncbi:MAG TPA: DUF1778 domain-containing protein [Opitutaceae bacterium]|nr:DUF1778 domain-containing protein [Opitutaceae bacterium]